jgi:hypothetical protein
VSARITTLLAETLPSAVLHNVCSSWNISKRVVELLLRNID